MNILQQDAIATVQRLFAKKNIALHADYGARYHPAPGLSPADWDLGQGNDAIALEESIEFAKIRTYKAQYMRPRRWNAFHYLVLAKAETDASLYGRAEISGNDVMLYYGTYKRLNFAYATQEDKNVIANMQAHTFAHELGHNLGLRHGGNEDASEKPNYVSEMSYLWRTWPPPGSEAAWYNYRRCRIPGYPAANSPRLPPAQFELNFSEGTRADVDESSLSDGFVDYNCNRSAELNYSFDANEDGQISVLKDYNDWANMKFAFYPSATVRVVTGPGFTPSPAVATPPRGSVIDDETDAME
jgi:Metallo-peptidase family M12B Reprolysin-like